MMETLRGTLRLASMAWREDRGRFLVSLILMLLQNISLPLAAPALAVLISAAVSGDRTTVQWSAPLLAALVILSLVAGHFGHIFYFELGEKVQLAIDVELMDVAHGSAGVEHHERPDYADKLRVLRQETGWVGWQSMSALFSTIGLGLAVTLTAIMLARLSPILLLLPLFALPALVLGRKAEGAMGQAREDAAVHTRRVRHMFTLATQAGSAKEVRACGLGEQVRAHQRDSWGRATRILMKGEDRSALFQVIGQFMFALAYIGATILVVRNVVAGNGDVGDVVLVITLAAQVNQQVTAAVGLLVLLQRLSRSLTNLTWMRALVLSERPTPDRDVPAVMTTGLAIRDLSFRYPGTDRIVLDNVNLEIPAGTTMAIVGENGAGKTTLVKLLCRFYEATGGVIEVDGVDVRRLPLEGWRERIAAGFQDFVRLEFSAQHAVGVGDLPLVDSAGAVTDALDRAHAQDMLGRLGDGLDTKLGKRNWDGTELSGGQWQKLALGRAMMRPEPLLLILDEPTAALDAQAEHDLFERYAESAKRVAQRTGAVTVLVSHRFSTVRMADLIVVVGDGRIAQVGTHQELMDQGGTYAELYSLQAQQYS